MDKDHRTRPEGAPQPAPLPSFWNDRTIEKLVMIAHQAGTLTLDIRASGQLDIQTKEDHSPVTRADLASQAFISSALSELTPDIPVIAEEDDIQPALPACGTCWLVDPLDSTRHFIKGGNDFSVNIGLLIEGSPVLGIIYAPARDDLFFGGGSLAFRQKGKDRIPLSVLSPAPLQRPPRLIVSEREDKHLDLCALQRAGHIASWRVCQSAYKIALLAAGEADLFLRTGVTSEWDTAAGQALLEAVGASLYQADGSKLSYGKKDLKNGILLAASNSLGKESLSFFLDYLNGSSPA